MANVSGLGVAYVVGGFVIFWSGFRNNSIADTVKGFLSGKVPQDNPEAAPMIGIADTSSGSSSSSGSAGGAVATSSQIANDAQKYVGHCYRFGGAPGPNGTGCWDCSSFVNWVLAHDLHMAIPLGQWDFSTHGPATGDYLLWSGAKTIGHSASQAQAGDLCVWQTHMGFALGGGQMISALNESLGTRITTISGGAPGGELLFVRRLNA